MPTSARLRMRSGVVWGTSSLIHSGRPHFASIFIPSSPLEGSGAKASGTGITATIHDLGLLYLAVDSS